LLLILRFCCPFTNSTSKVNILPGLEINTTKTEGMWLSSWKNKTDMPFGFCWPQDPIKALDVFFSFDENKANQLNFAEKI